MAETERMEQIKVVLQAMEKSGLPSCQACDEAYDALEARRVALVAELQKVDAELHSWRYCPACKQADEAQDAKRQALVAEWQALHDAHDGAAPQ